MTTVIKRSETVTLTEKRRDILRAVGWQVTQSLWSPPTDVYETDKEYIVRVEMAGVREEDFKVIFEDGFLFISGVRRDVAERRAYHQMEIRFGKFSTAVGVPGPVELDRSTAEYEDGFLIVRLPKAGSTKVKIED